MRSSVGGSVRVSTWTSSPSSLASRVQVIPFEIPPWYLAALVISYVGAPLLAAVPTDRALTALTLVLVAVLAFGVALRR